MRVTPRSCRMALLPAGLLWFGMATAAEPAPAQVSAPPTVTVTAGPGTKIDSVACPVISEYADGVPLPAVQAALHAGQLSILVVGSGTVLGPDTGGLATSFPYAMARAFKAAVPSAAITLTVRGGKGLTAAEMLPLIRQETTASHYQLVLWQTGTVEAVRSLPVDELSDTLDAGIEQVTSSGGNLVLIDPQYSRFLRANANLDPYQLALEQAAGAPGVGLFRRFELMHDWVENGGIDLEHAAPGDRQKVAGLLHACLGRALARLVLNEAGMQAALGGGPGNP